MQASALRELLSTLIILNLSTFNVCIEPANDEHFSNGAKIVLKNGRKNFSRSLN